jgi:hypothetical protein
MTIDKMAVIAPPHALERYRNKSTVGLWLLRRGHPLLASRWLFPHDRTALPRTLIVIGAAAGARSLEGLTSPFVRSYESPSWQHRGCSMSQGSRAVRLRRRCPLRRYLFFFPCVPLASSHPAGKSFLRSPFPPPPSRRLLHPDPEPSQVAVDTVPSKDQGHPSPVPGPGGLPVVAH